ncbi:hypothetical protein GGI43DRAFT_409940 [Trichoderma evansii]
MKRLLDISSFLQRPVCSLGGFPPIVLEVGLILFSAMCLESRRIAFIILIFTFPIFYGVFYNDLHSLDQLASLPVLRNKKFSPSSLF